MSSTEEKASSGDWKCPNCESKNPVEEVICLVCGHSRDEKPKVIINPPPEPSPKPSPKKETGKSFKFAFIISTIVAAVLVIACIILFSELSKANKTIVSQSEELADTQQQLSKKQKELSNSQAELNIVQGRYTQLCSALDTEHLGYAKDTFKISIPILHMKLSDEPRTVKLSAYRNAGATVSVDQIAGTGRCRIDFAREQWTYDVDLVLTPAASGVAVYRFSNSRDSATFDFIVVITD